jgi:hypothetical protein
MMRMTVRQSIAQATAKERERKNESRRYNGNQYLITINFNVARNYDSALGGGIRTAPNKCKHDDGECTLFFVLSSLV